MLNPKSAISVKISLDLLFIFLSVNSFFWGIFTYDSDFEIGAITLRYKFTKNSMDAYVESNYSDFDKYLCGSTIIQTIALCDKISNFKASGICFLVIGGLANMFAMYCILNLLGKLCHCTAKGCTQLDFTNYLYPGLHLLGIGLYLIISNIFTLSSVSVQIGIFMMFGAQIVSIASLIIFFINRTIINESSMIYNVDRKEIADKEETKKSQIEDKEIELDVSADVTPKIEDPLEVNTQNKPLLK